MEYFQGAYLSENTIRFGIFNNPNLVFKTYSSNNNIKKNTGDWKKKEIQAVPQHEMSTYNSCL